MRGVATVMTLDAARILLSRDECRDVCSYVMRRKVAGCYCRCLCLPGRWCAYAQLASCLQCCLSAVVFCFVCAGSVTFRFLEVGEAEKHLRRLCKSQMNVQSPIPNLQRPALYIRHTTIPDRYFANTALFRPRMDKQRRSCDSRIMLRLNATI
ncbi:hypothetical protein F5Y10DRAFT_87128 [Nemania abortiva]|nr:hypothetical protein F5Y10DRAFT_87128 [Nemania abortiva]